MLLNILQCLGQPYNNNLVESPGLGQCLHIYSKSSTHISCYDNMVTYVPVFTTHLAVKEIEAWRGIETKVGAGCPISGGARWSSGFQAGRWGDSRDPDLSLVLVAPPGFPAWCQRCHLPVTMMPRAKTLSQPLLMCEVFVTLSCPLCWQPWKVGGGRCLFISAHAKLCLAAGCCVGSPGPGSSSSAS